MNDYYKEKCETLRRLLDAGLPQLQALLDKGWELKVRKESVLFKGENVLDRPYTAQINSSEIVLDVVSGHCHTGRTLQEALAALEEYVTAQGKEGVRNEE